MPVAGYLSRAQHIPLGLGAKGTVRKSMEKISFLWDNYKT